MSVRFDVAFITDDRESLRQAQRAADSSGSETNITEKAGPWNIPTFSGRLHKRYSISNGFDLASSGVGGMAVKP